MNLADQIASARGAFRFLRLTLQPTATRKREEALDEIEALLDRIEQLGCDWPDCPNPGVVQLCPDHLPPPEETQVEPYKVTFSPQAAAAIAKLGLSDPDAPAELVTHSICPSGDHVSDLRPGDDGRFACTVCDYAPEVREVTWEDAPQVLKDFFAPLLKEKEESP